MSDDATADPVPTIVLLHGGGTTGRQWDLVLDELRAPALAPNVPGRLDRPADPQEVTLDAALTSIVADVDAATDGPVVLVAHSSGGLLVPGLVDRLAGRVRALVWLAASIPAEGGTGMDCMQPRHRERIEQFKAYAESSGVPFVTPAEPPERERMRTAYGEPLTEEQLDFVLDPVRWVSDTYNFYFEPLSLGALAPLHRLYIRTLRDRAVSIELQEAMLARMPGTPTIALDSGHVPMVTMAATVAAIVDGVAADVARADG